MMLVEKLMLLNPGITEESLTLYVMIAQGVIKEYLKNFCNIEVSEDDVLNEFETALLILVDNSIKAIKTNNIKSKSEGNRSISYSITDSFKVTDDIKAYLPMPRIKMMG